MKKLFKIDDSEVQKIPIQDNDEQVVDMRDYGNIIVATDKEYPEIISSCRSFVRKTVADKLIKAQLHLPNGIKFKLLEGSRPVSVQKKIFEGYMESLAKKHPEWNEDTLYQKTSTFVAPWDNTPPHSTGGAIDITLATEDGKELNMGTGMKNVYDDIYDDTCYTDAEVSRTCRKNREILIEALTKEGFVNYPAEWWHWSYGDRYWALLTQKDHAIYGSVDIGGIANDKMQVSVSKGY